MIYWIYEFNFYISTLLYVFVSYAIIQAHSKWVALIDRVQFNLLPFWLLIEENCELFPTLSLPFSFTQIVYFNFFLLILNRCVAARVPIIWPSPWNKSTLWRYLIHTLFRCHSLYIHKFVTSMDANLRERKKIYNKEYEWKKNISDSE